MNDPINMTKENVIEKAKAIMAIIDASYDTTFKSFDENLANTAMNDAIDHVANYATIKELNNPYTMVLGYFVKGLRIYSKKLKSI